ALRLPKITSMHVRQTMHRIRGPLRAILPVDATDQAMAARWLLACTRYSTARVGTERNDDGADPSHDNTEQPEEWFDIVMGSLF
ncbi:hypothetical protein ACWEPL_57770, partial [Nonomuraea sp. NPDC004186]